MGGWQERGRKERDESDGRNFRLNGEWKHLKKRRERQRKCE